MRILLLSEGDAETRDSWSGISKSVVDELRRSGHEVVTGDVELYGPARLWAAIVTSALQRQRWSTRFRLGAVPFHLRSLNAGRRIAKVAGRVDVILQVGATFEPLGRGTLPYALFCDSNILLARHGASTGHSEAFALKQAELDGIAAREASVYAHACTIFTLSERTRRSFIQDFGTAADRVRAVYAGPNFDLGALPESSATPAESPPTVLFVGRQFARKGGDLLLSAFRRIREQIPDAQLLVVGPEHRDISEPGVRAMGFLNKDTKAGWQALAGAYAAADVFCMPTRFEAFGIAYIEAMHFGLPCVGTNVWAVPEIIAEGETGFLVPPDDVGSLADRLLRLLKDRGLARRMGLAGRARANHLFTWPRVIGRMLEALNYQGVRPSR
jgi:alpha-maltose-1-phosphate synthase